VGNYQGAQRRTFIFPIGEKPLGKKQFEPAHTTLIDGVVWYRDGKERPKENQLSIADGSEGWAAYAIDGKLFLKKFEDTKPDVQAPGEAEVLFYASREADYIEFEIQGKYESIEPGAGSSWSVRWIAVNIPSDIKIEEGSSDMVDLARKICRTQRP